MGHLLLFLRKFPVAIFCNRFVVTQILLFFFSICVVNAQNFKEGFIISFNGDSTKGFIKFNDKKIFKSCQFKVTINGDVLRYTPEQIQGFRFNEGKYFVSRDVMVDGKEEKLFLEYIIEGKANIYYYRDDSDHYFIDTDSSELIELTQKKVYFKRNDTRPYELPKKHKQKLKLVLKDCPEIYPQIDLVALNHKSLTKLAKSYHYQVCDTEDCVIFERKTNTIKTKISVIIGGGFHTLKLGNDLNSKAENAFNYGVRFEFGDVFPWTEKTFINIDFSLQNFGPYNFSIRDGQTIRYKNKGNEYVIFNSKYDDTDINQIDADLTFTTLQIPCGIIYYFSSAGLKSYIKAGINNQIILSQNDGFLYEKFTDEFNKTMPTYQLGFNGGAGIKMLISKRTAFLLEVRYDYYSNLNDKSLKIKISQLGCKIGFQFF